MHNILKYLNKFFWLPMKRVNFLFTGMCDVEAKFPMVGKFKFKLVTLNVVYIVFTVYLNTRFIWIFLRSFKLKLIIEQLVKLIHTVLVFFLSFSWVFQLHLKKSIRSRLSVRFRELLVCKNQWLNYSNFDKFNI